MQPRKLYFALAALWSGALFAVWMAVRPAVSTEEGKPRPQAAATITTLPPFELFIPTRPQTEPSSTPVAKPDSPSDASPPPGEAAENSAREMNTSDATDSQTSANDNIALGNYTSDDADEGDGSHLLGKWNGFTYLVVAAPQGIMWRDAEAAARARGGYLAVIHSEEVNELVFKLADFPQFWHFDAERLASIGPWINIYGKMDRLSFPSPVPNLPARSITAWFWRSSIEWERVKSNPATMATYFNWYIGIDNYRVASGLRGVCYYALGPVPMPTWGDQDWNSLAYAYVVEYPPYRGFLRYPRTVRPYRPLDPAHPRTVIEEIPATEPVDNAIGRFEDSTFQVFIAPNGVTWYDATVTAMQNGGHLATITSPAENDFVFNLVNRAEFWRFSPQYNISIGPWIGGERPGSLAGFGASDNFFQWRWGVNHDGSRAILSWIHNLHIVYFPWAKGQPASRTLPIYQNGRRTQCLLFYANGDNRTPTWGVLPWDSHTYSFVVEWDKTSDPKRMPAAPPATGQSTSLGFTSPQQ